METKGELTRFVEWAACATKQELQNWLDYGSPMSPKHQQDVREAIYQRVRIHSLGPGKKLPEGVLQEIEALESQLLRNAQIPGEYRRGL